MSSVAVTGATGYVGSAIARRLGSAGRRVVALGRHAAESADEWRHFELGGSVSPDLFDGCDTLVHCAWDLTVTSRSTVFERNVAGTIALFEAATRCGVRRLVFISSMSAYEGTTQTYGRAKLVCEHAAIGYGGVNLRLGLVHSGDAGGMVGALRQVVRHPVVPVIGLRSYQFTVSLDDVVRAVELAVAEPTLTGTVGVAHPRRVPMRDILLRLLPEGQPAPRLVPVPWRAVYAAMRAAEAARLRLPFRADSILGLVRPAAEVPRASEWREHGVTMTPW